MPLASARSVSASTDLAPVVRDFLHVEIVGLGHVAPHGRVSVSDHGILAHAGPSSILNRAAALDLEQFDVALAEVDQFFGRLAHTLWLEAESVSADVDRLLRTRGYVALPEQHGMACVDLPDELGRAEPDHHADLLTDPARASEVADVQASGFGLGVDDRLLFEDINRAVLRHAKPWDHGALYGIREQERLVSVGALLCTAESAGLTGLATLPEHRRHGHGSVVAARALHDAAALGHAVAVAVASPDSHGLLEALGFHTVSTYHVYRQARP